jgi:hypothetical protein
MKDKLEVFEYVNGLLGICSAIDDYVYEERFNTRAHAEAWVASGGAPTNLESCYGNVFDEDFPIFSKDGQFVRWQAVVVGLPN